MESSRVAVRLGRTILHNKTSDIELDMRTIAYLTSTVLDAETVEQRTAVLLNGDDPQAIYIDRPSQLCIVCDVETLSSSGSHMVCVDILMSLLSGAECWSQLQWKCISSREERISDTFSTLRLSFTNDSPSAHRKRKLHGINLDVPFHDVRAPEGIATAQLNSVHYSICTSIPQQSFVNQASETQLDVSSPLIQQASSILQPVDEDDYATDMTELDGLMTSPLLQPCIDTDDALLMLMSDTTYSNGSASPRSVFSALEGELAEHIDKGHLVQVFDIAFRSSVQQDVRIPKAISIQKATQPLSLLAPSVFLPTFAIAMADRAPFMSRIGAALEACAGPQASDMPEHGEQSTPQLSLGLQQANLWSKMRHKLFRKHQKTCLKALTLSSAALVSYSFENNMLDESSNDDGMSACALSLQSSEDDLDSLFSDGVLESE